MIVLDTHVLVWWISGDPHLSRKAAAAIRKEYATGRLGLAAISTWEIGMLVAKGRLRLGMDVAEWLHTALAIRGMTLLPLSVNVALDSTQLPGEFHGDPADRMIVATARAENVALVTADQRIRAYRHVRTIW